MLVVVRVDAETGDKAVDHKVHIGTLAARATREWLCGIEEQGLTGDTKASSWSGQGECRV